MRKVILRPSGEEFENWRKKAQAARDELIRSWRAERDAAARDDRPCAWKPEINEKLYKEIRQVFLKKAFYSKCAYCEANSSANYPVQVEHYRPKGAITENRVAVSAIGYFWLVYEWWNLLPSCSYCNTNHTDPLRGRTDPGKKNEFPVEAARITEPSDNPEAWIDQLKGEHASLLNPYFDEPEKHIDFAPKTGAPIPLTPRGRVTIELCDLKRPSLCERRRDLRTDALDGMVFGMMKGRDLDSVVPPSKEFTLWRKRIVQQRLLELCERAGLPVRRAGV
jgi:hypothetical protein